MPNTPRQFIDGVSIHAIRRGLNRMRIVHGDDDCAVLLTLLRQAAIRRAVHVHAYVLMPTHVHLIVTPQTRTALPKMMQDVGYRYTRYYNCRYQRIGTLWNGRYRALLIDSEDYWYTCARYLDQNPVRARIVASPEQYRWSSYCAYSGGIRPDWLTPHAAYLSLGMTDRERQIAYREFGGVALAEHELLLMRTVPFAPGDVALPAAV